MDIGNEDAMIAGKRIAVAARGLMTSALVVIATNCMSAQATDQRSAHGTDLTRAVSEMRTAIRFAAEASDRNLATHDARVESLVIGNAACAPMRAVRASFPASPHDPKFIAAFTHKKLFRLGGFTSPDVAELIGSLKAGTSTEGFLDLARCLGRVLDPNGALLLVPIGDSAAVAADDFNVRVRTRWISERPNYSTRDTAVLRSDGSTWARVSYLTGAERLGGTEWTWRSYVFGFDRAGSLLAWHVRVDEPVLLK